MPPKVKNKQSIQTCCSRSEAVFAELMFLRSSSCHWTASQQTIARRTSGDVLKSKSVLDKTLVHVTFPTIFTPRNLNLILKTKSVFDTTLVHITFPTTFTPRNDEQWRNLRNGRQSQCTWASENRISSLHQRPTIRMKKKKHRKTIQRRYQSFMMRKAWTEQKATVATAHSKRVH